MPVAIVTDSAAALPAEIADERSIAVVPMWLTIDGTAVREGEMSLDQLLTHPDVKTSGPSPGEFATVVEEQLARDDGVVVLHDRVGDEQHARSRGARCASRGRRRSGRRHARRPRARRRSSCSPRRRRAASGASIEAVVERRRAGDPADAARRHASRRSSTSCRGGRVPSIAGWAGHVLGIAPLFEFRNGRARPLRPALGTEVAYDRILSRWRRDRVPGAELHVAALHANARPTRSGCSTACASEAEPKTSFVGEFGTVMVAHTGPGLVGLAWRWAVPHSGLTSGGQDPGDRVTDRVDRGRFERVPHVGDDAEPLRSGRRRRRARTASRVGIRRSSATVHVRDRLRAPRRRARPAAPGSSSAGHRARR